MTNHYRSILRSSSRSLICFLSLAWCSAQASADDVCYTRVVTSEKPGPVVVVVVAPIGIGSAGGDVIRQLQYQAPTSGTLVLVEQGPEFVQRYTPLFQFKFFADIDRLLLTEPGPDLTQRKPPLGWEKLVKLSDLEQRFPQHIKLMLSEAVESSTQQPSAAGDTIQGKHAAVADMLKAINELPMTTRRIWRSSPGVGKEQTIVVTTTAIEDRKNDLRLALRHRQMRSATQALLRHLGMIDQANRNQSVLFPEHRGAMTRVAVFDDSGSMVSPVAYKYQLAQRQDFVVEVVGAPEIRGGVLDRVDVLLVGGGKTTPQSNALGKEGLQAIQAFVRRGGGYLGICAGAYLASQSRSYCQHLDLLPFDTQNTSVTGAQAVTWQKNPLGLAHGDQGLMLGGPLLIPRPESGEKLTVWASFTENGLEGSKVIPLKNTPMAISGRFGAGKVLVFSTHCESSPTPATFFPDAIGWCGKP
jgi:hypothetical protein